MKHLLILFFIALVGGNAYGQNIIGYLKSFCNDANMNCYYEMIQRNVNLFFHQDHESWKREEHNIPCPNIEIQTDANDTILITKSVYSNSGDFIKSEITHIIPLVSIQFINTDKFNIEDNVYEYLSLDSTVVFTLASVDKKNNISSFLHFFDGYTGYERVECHSLAFFKKIYPKYLAQYRKNLPYAIKRIQQHNPDLIMITHFGNENIGRFLFVKNFDIYYYDVVNDTEVELNTFLKQNYKLAQLRTLNKKCIPYIYSNMGAKAISNNTPKLPINLCE